MTKSIVMSVTSRNSLILTGCALILFCSGCATIFRGTTQKVKINSSPQGAEIYVCGKNTGKVTPSEVTINRRVKKTKLMKSNGQYLEVKKEGRRNEQSYVLKKEGYDDLMIKDRRKISVGGFISNAPLIGVAAYGGLEAILATWLGTVGGLCLSGPLAISAVIDFSTGAMYTYNKEFFGELKPANKPDKVTANSNQHVVVKNNTNTDVDNNIPIDTLVQHNTYALIIGNEDYCMYSGQSAPFNFII
jgi:hypothetical protein